ncbi:aldehyde dehydrogenase family protein [Nocardia sp. NPDC058519]|uniref:aldehyde dehydrogenase family protein n=1 Tax=Nocardia sp. NPDC058519 TaxID=3346535 RepID=UPI003649E15A
MTVQHLVDRMRSGPPDVEVSEYVSRARRAQREFDAYSQSEVDRVVTAVGWAIYEPTRARALAELAVRSTGMGIVSDKFDKNRRKTLGTLSDLHGVVSVGEIHRDDAAGIVEYAKPMGVVAAICPSTNAAAAPANISMHILKGRNAVVLSPSPRALSTCRELVGYVRAELGAIGAPADLVQVLDPVTKARSDELIVAADFAVVTGSEANVRAAYRSGTPVSGVGKGNPQIIVCADADIVAAVEKIVKSKTFDNGISCSSESVLHIQESVYGAVTVALSDAGGQLLEGSEVERLRDLMWLDGKLNRDVVGKTAHQLLSAARIEPRPGVGFIMVELSDCDELDPFSGEKMAPILAMHSYGGLDEVLGRIGNILDYQGAGHSCGIHTVSTEAAERVAATVRVARVIVNQPHVVGNSGAFDNGLACTLSVGGGTWAGNSTCDNIDYRHFINRTKLVRTIPAIVPDEEILFSRYLRSAAQVVSGGEFAPIREVQRHGR